MSAAVVTIASEAMEQAARLFTYVPDPENDHWSDKPADRWDCWADDVDAGRPFRDDCDGFACTMAELLLRRGIPREKVHLLLCKLSGSWHLVCGVDTEDGPLLLDQGVATWKRDAHRYSEFSQVVRAAARSSG